jgi:hypothetical protein
VAYNPLKTSSEQGFADNLYQGNLMGVAGNVWEAARDEYLGIDDARRAIEKAKDGNFLGALKSLATGGLELGTTIIPGMQAAKLAKLPKAARGVSKLLGAGAKTPTRGVVTNVAANTGLAYGLPAAAGQVPGLNRLFQAAPALAEAPVMGMQDESTARIMASLYGTSPDAANSEALIRLMLQQGMI